MHHRSRGRHRRRQRHHAFGQAFGMFGAMRGRLFGPGELRLALLSLLAEGPMHGYELMKQLEARSGGLYRASAGSVYPTLQQLEDEGLAQSQELEGKRVYRLTEAGEALVQEEEPALRRIWRRADEWDDWSHAASPDTWEIARPAMDLGKAAFRAVSRAEGDPDVIDDVRRILERAKRDIEKL